MEAILNNGKTYRFEQFLSLIFVYCLTDGKWNQLSIDFKNWDEVQNWIEQMNKPTLNESFSNVIPVDYYSDFNRYYGD